MGHMTAIQPTGALVTRRSINGGEQIIARLPNGYGASIVRHDFSYGGTAGKWELAVISFTGEGPNDFDLVYDTPITDDVIGWLSEEEAVEICEQIARLDPLTRTFKEGT